MHIESPYPFLILKPMLILVFFWGYRRKKINTILFFNSAIITFFIYMLLYFLNFFTDHFDIDAEIHPYDILFNFLILTFTFSLINFKIRKKTV